MLSNMSAYDEKTNCDTMQKRNELQTVFSPSQLIIQSSSEFEQQTSLVNLPIDYYPTASLKVKQHNTIKPVQKTTTKKTNLHSASSDTTQIQYKSQNSHQYKSPYIEAKGKRVPTDHQSRISLTMKQDILNQAKSALIQVTKQESNNNLIILSSTSKNNIENSNCSLNESKNNLSLKTPQALTNCNSQIIKQQFNFLQSPKINPKTLIQDNTIQKMNHLTTKNYNEDSDTSDVFNENVIKESLEKRNTNKGFLNKMIIQQVLTEKDIKDEPQSAKISSKVIPRNSLTNPGVMLDLNLRLANLKELQYKVIQQNPNLRCIDIRNNRISRLPDGICDLHYLWKLRVDYNYLTQLPFLIGQISSLSFISASQNKITVIPQSLFMLRGKLSVLQLNDNQISTIPHAIGDLIMLKSLLLHNNCFSSIPESMKNLIHLDELGLDWFQYMSLSINTPKIAQRNGSLETIKEFIAYCEVFEQAKKEMPDTEQITFVHFLMYFLGLEDLRELQLLRYKHKQRGITHYLSQNGHQYLYKEVLSHFEQLDINIEDEDGTTPILLAIKNKRMDMVKYLLSMPKTNINKSSKRYGHPLHMAIQCQEYKLALKLLKYQVKYPSKFLDVNTQNIDGNNSMHFIFLNFYQNPTGSKQLAKILIKRGINVNQRNKNSCTPLQLAIINNQTDAIKFALEYNKIVQQSKLGNYLDDLKQRSSLYFDFNIQGGMFNWNALHFAIQSSNLRTITILLESEEEISFTALDEEGKKPRDLCAYNSPIYKLVLRYEQKVMKAQFYKHLAAQTHNQTRIDQEITHFQLARKNMQSPAKVRERIIERARSIHDEKQKTASKHKQAELFYRSEGGRYESQSTWKEKYVSKDIEIKYESCSDYLNDVRFMSPTITTKSCSQLSNVHKNVKSFAPAQTDYFFLSNDVKKSMLGQKPEINTNISSPDASVDSGRGSRVGLPQSKEVSKKSSHSGKNKFIVHQLLNLEHNRKQENTSDRGFALCFNQVVLNDNNESVAKDKTPDDEDDANIPEDENDHIDSVQLERPKSQIRVLNKSFSSQNVFDSTPQKKKLDTALKILKVLSAQRLGEQQSESFSPLMPFMYPPVMTNATLTTSQYQVTDIVRDADVSVIEGVKEEQTGINQPRQDNFSPKFGSTFSRFSDLKSRFKEEVLELQLDYSNTCQISKFFANLYKYRDPKSSSNDAKLDIRAFQYSYKQDQFSMMFMVDKGYYVMHFNNKEQIVKMVNNSFALTISAPKTMSKNIITLYQYELINSLYINLYNREQQQQKNKKMYPFSFTDTITESSPMRTNKHFINGPNLRVHLYKSPSLASLKIQNLKSSTLQSSPNKPNPKTNKFEHSQSITLSTNIIPIAPQTTKNSKCSAFKLKQKLIEPPQSVEKQSTAPKRNFESNRKLNQIVKESKQQVLKQYLNTNHLSQYSGSQQHHGKLIIDNKAKSTLIMYSKTLKN